MLRGKTEEMLAHKHDNLPVNDMSRPGLISTLIVMAILVMAMSARSSGALAGRGAAAGRRRHLACRRHDFLSGARSGRGLRAKLLGMDRGRRRRRMGYVQAAVCVRGAAWRTQSFRHFERLGRKQSECCDVAGQDHSRPRARRKRRQDGCCGMRRRDGSRLHCAQAQRQIAGCRRSISRPSNAISFAC